MTFIILNYNYVVWSEVEDFDWSKFDQRFENFLISLCFITFLMFIFVPIIYIIYKARRKQLVLEDGIENGIDSPPKYCVEESPPTYQEAINIEKNPIYQNPIFSDAEISIIL